MLYHDPLLSEGTEAKDKVADMVEVADVADLLQKNDNIASITTSAFTVAKVDIS